MDTYKGQQVYKILDSAGNACNGGRFLYSLPRGKRPGRWTPRVPYPSICCRGYHLAVGGIGLGEWLLDSLDAQYKRVFLVEFKPEPADLNVERDKICVEQVRLTRELNWGPEVYDIYSTERREREAAGKETYGWDVRRAKQHLFGKAKSSRHLAPKWLLET